MKSLFVTSLMVFGVTAAHAQVVPNPTGPESAARTKAAIIYQRLTGTKIPLDAPILTQMETKIAAGDSVGAAALATAEPGFLNNTVKQMGARMSTRDESYTAGLNDFVATMIGIVRDDKSAKDFLIGDYIYVPTAATQALPIFKPNAQNDFTTTTANGMEDNMLISNRVYSVTEDARVDLGTALEIRNGQPILVRPRTMTTANTIRDNTDTAGLLTTRSFAVAHAIDGTNRRMVQFAFRQFLCIDILQWADASAPDARVGRDVERTPGGDPNYFLKTCKACHSVMDGFRDAFSSIDVRNGDFSIKQYLFDDQADRQVVVNGSKVASKYARGSGAFPAGHITVDASWENFANQGTNAQFFGWRGQNVSGGVGVHSFGQLLADSEAFSRCMVQRVYRSVCRRDVASTESSFLANQSKKFEADYNMKKLFQRVVVSPECIGQ